MSLRSLAGLGLAVLSVLASASSPASAAMLRTLHTSCSKEPGCRDGAIPGQLVADAAGNLYGTTQEMGVRHGKGGIFELEGGRRFKALYTFCERVAICPDGYGPAPQLVMDNAGNLYGVTNGGGLYDRGIAFELQPNSLRTAWSLTKLYDFCGPDDPACAAGSGEPRTGLTYAGAASGAGYDGTSPLYGVISGSNGTPGVAGAVYALTPGSPWTVSLVYAFCGQGGGACTDGALPGSALAMDAAGNLFGNTAAGGDTGNGVVFELNPPPPAASSWTYTVLHSFCPAGAPPCADGEQPLSTVVLDAAGNVYGTTIFGGRQCRSAPLQGSTCGVVYEIVPNGTNSVETVLHKFCAKENCSDGAFPAGGLAIDAAGNLYGTTETGDSNAGADPSGPGVLFVLEPLAGGARYKVLHQFCALADCSDGQEPQFAPIVANDALYGPTRTTVFRYAPLP
jgi:hypothetical protein